MPDTEEHGLMPKGAEGAQIKRDITEAKQAAHTKEEAFDPGASQLGTDNEAGSPPDHDEMAQARKAPKP